MLDIDIWLSELVHNIGDHRRYNVCGCYISRSHYVGRCRVDDHVLASVGFGERTVYRTTLEAD